MKIADYSIIFNFRNMNQSTTIWQIASLSILNLGFIYYVRQFVSIPSFVTQNVLRLLHLYHSWSCNGMVTGRHGNGEITLQSADQCCHIWRLTNAWLPALGI